MIAEGERERPAFADQPLHKASTFAEAMVRQDGVSGGYGVPSKLSEAHKFEVQQYVTRCYGSLTTFNILFKNKDVQFRTGAVDRSTS